MLKTITLLGLGHALVFLTLKPSLEVSDNHRRQQGCDLLESVILLPDLLQ